MTFRTEPSSYLFSKRICHADARRPDGASRSDVPRVEASDAKKLKALEAENAKLKKLLAEQMMDVSTVKEMLGMGEGERHAFERAYGRF